MFLELIKQAPALAGVIIVILILMRHISKLSEEFRDIWREFKEIHRESMNLIRENTEATLETGRIVRESAALIRESYPYKPKRS